MAVAGCPLYTNEAIAALPIHNPGILSRNFLQYALLAKSHEGTANTAVLGKVLNKEKVQNILIPVPPVEEQEWIVKLLDEADEFYGGCVPKLMSGQPHSFLRYSLKCSGTRRSTHKNYPLFVSVICVRFRQITGQ